MKCSTKKGVEQAMLLIEQTWDEVPKKMGIDLEQSARETKAIQRLREIRNAGDLLRLILFYAASGWSLRLTGAWAFSRGIGYLSDVAILNRLRNSWAWLGKLVALLLKQRCSALRSMPGVRLRLVDATCVSRPGSKGIDWRIHLGFDLGNFCLDHVELTDCHGGESLVRFDPQGNEIFIADGGYAYASGIGPLVARGGGLVVRINWRNVAVFTPEGQRFQIVPWLKTITCPAERLVELKTPQGWFTFRLIAAPIPPEKAEAARRRVRKRYQRKQLPLSEDTLFAAGFITLLTNLPADPWPLTLVLCLYRIRWQVEIVFKRLKSLLLFDHLRGKDPRLAKSFLLAKLLLALLVDLRIHQVDLYQTEWFISLDHPANLSRLTVWFFDDLRQIIFGPPFFRDLTLLLCAMQRYFCDPPRKRLQQLALGRALLQHICFSSPFPLS